MSLDSYLFSKLCLLLLGVLGCAENSTSSIPQADSAATETAVAPSGDSQTSRSVETDKFETDKFETDVSDLVVPVSFLTMIAETESEGDQERESLEYEHWEQPEVALFISGRQHGYIEPCGCTGLANQKGGMLRRDTLRRQIEARGWPLIKIDAGNQIRRLGEQPRIKFATSIESLARVMEYDVIGLGPDDLRLPTIQLADSAVNNVPDDSNLPFVVSNAGLWDFTFFKPFEVIERGGRKIGVMTVLGDEYRETISNEEIVFKPSDDAIAEIWPKLQEQGCDTYVLIAQTTLENSEVIANKFPHFDILISTGGSGEPTMAPKPIRTGDHTTNMIQVGTKGMYAGVIGLYDDPDTPLRYQRIPLDDRYEDSEAMKKIFVDYQEQLENAGLEGLGLKAGPHPSGLTYVGSRACADCHDYAYKVWKKGNPETGDKFGPHSHATKSLTEPNERVWVTRFHDPECLSCHTTGWNPQMYFPYEGGFVDLVESKLLHGNGCENCHGPGSRHVAAENGDIDVSDDEMKKLQQSMVLTVEEARETKCMECHDLDNSPDFHDKGAFDEYWARIVHNEDDE